MKKLLFVLPIVVLLSACGSTKVSEKEVKSWESKVTENSVQHGNIKVDENWPSLWTGNVEEDTKEVLKVVDDILGD